MVAVIKQDGEKGSRRRRRSHQPHVASKKRRKFWVLTALAALEGLGGDALLQSFSAMLRRVVRAEDVVCRYGGEEFVAVLAECDAALAMRRAEEMREATRALRVVHRGAQLGVVTVSVGVANLGSHGRRSADLVRAADSALYRATSAGRDRVVVADAAADAAA